MLGNDCFEIPEMLLVLRPLFKTFQNENNLITIVPMISNPPTVHTTMITVIVPSEFEVNVDELVRVVPADTAVTDATAKLSEGIMRT